MQNFGIEVAQGSEITNLTIPTGTSFPANDNVGEMFYRTDEDKLYIRNNTTWEEVTTSSGVIFLKADGTVEMTGALVLSGNPTLDNHAATKTYVDGLVTGLDTKDSVHVATTTNITLTGTLTIDGVLTTANDRVLVKNQTDATQNGIYDVQGGAWVRSDDADNTPTNEVSGGMYCFVEEGTVNADTGWTMASPSGDAVLGTDDLDFVKFSNVIAPVSSVAGKTGAITLVEADISDFNNYLRSDSNTLATSVISTTNTITAGRDGGGISLTVNDGYGNANVTFNNVSGIPEQDGNSARIAVNTDNTSNSNMSFQLQSNVTDGVATSSLISAFTIYETECQILGNTVYHTGNPPPTSGGAEVGSVITMSDNGLPTGYLKCNGATISRTTYASLFAYVGTLYGAGNGSTTFKLPDYRGEFLRGWDNGRGIDSGRGIGTYQADEFESHTHELPMWNNSSEKSQHTGGAGVATTSGQTRKITLGTGSTETRPRNRAVMYVIKY